MRYSYALKAYQIRQVTVFAMHTASALTLTPAPGWALFLDVDGTILHLRDTPDGIEAGENLLNILELILARLDGAVALVSGRGIDTLDSMFAPHQLPTAGLHGLERRSAGLDTGQSSSKRARFVCGHVKTWPSHLRRGGRARGQAVQRERQAGARQEADAQGRRASNAPAR